MTSCAPLPATTTRTLDPILDDALAVAHAVVGACSPRSMGRDAGARGSCTPSESAWTVRVRAHAWACCRGLPAPAGFDPATIWPDGPDSPGAGVLRLDPNRVQVALGADLASGASVRTWRS